jgi:hypothetical protein
MTVVGVTGHQKIPDQAMEYVVSGVRAYLAAVPGPLVGVTSLAAGADQIFAREVLAAGGSLVAVIPSEGYEATFPAEGLADYLALLARCAEAVTLPYPEPNEQAFMSAGEEVIRRSDALVAVWDGLPAVGLGGTADAVAYARSLGKPVEVVWPEGVRR